MIHAFRLGRLSAATAAGFLLAASAHAASTPSANPWAKVPAFPTGCYQSEDPFTEQVETALTAVQDAHDKQNDVNSEVAQAATDAMSKDPMAMSRRMQEVMMKDPENAEKVMQKMYNLGQTVQADEPAMSEKEAQLKEETKALVARYEAALQQSHAPGDARWTALKKKMGLGPEARGPGESGVPDWAWAEWGVILREWDSGDQATCAEWWAATGPMQAQMKRYKDYLITERIPHRQKYFDEPKLEQFEMLGIDAKRYASVAELEAVEDYLKLARELFGQRLDRPRCKGEHCE
jgi:hypothetical protein